MTLPCDHEAEIAVLGSLLTGSPEALDGALATLATPHFVLTSHGLIWDAIAELGAKSAPVDALTVCGVLKDRGTLDSAGGEHAVFALTAKVCTGAHFVYWLERMLEKYRKRRIMEIGDLMGREAQSGDTSWEIIEKLEAEISSLSQFGSLSTQDQKPGGLEEVKEAIAARERGDKDSCMSSGIPSFDLNLTGIKPSQYYALSGRISAGKTAMADQITLHLLRSDIPVLYIGLEGTRRRVLEKMTAKIAQASYFNFAKGNLSPEFQARMKRAIGLLEKMPLVLITPPDITGPQIRALMRRHSRSHQTKVLVIDYLQKVKPYPGSDGERLAIAEASSQIQRGCIETGMAAIVVCQLNREADTSARPRMSNLKGSGQIEQDADNVLMLWSEKDKHDLELGELMPVTMSLEKNKDGPSCIDHHLLFDGSLMTFREQTKERETPKGYSPWLNLP